MPSAPELRAALERFMRLDVDRLRADPTGFATLVGKAQEAGRKALATQPTGLTALVEATAPTTRAGVREALPSFCVFGR
jgi:hypothetical protein